MTTTNTDGDGVQIIGHRGCADQYTENTVSAVEQSAPHVDMVEIDVQRCGSGELVVFHDDTLDRLTDTTGPVAATGWETIRDLTVGGSDQTIPRLSALLDAVPPTTGVNLELKDTGLAEDLLAVTDGIDNAVLYSSFAVPALRELRDVDPSTDRALILPDAAGRPLARATELGCVAVHPHYDVVLDSEFAAKAHDTGLAVNTWTVDSAETAAELVRAGVDGLVVDRWDLVGDTA